MARSKYKAVPTVVDGVRFASKAEAHRDWELQQLAKAGKIYGLRRQPRFPLVVQGVEVCTYVADWEYVEKPDASGTTQTVVEDKKGVQTRDFKLKWKLAKALYPEIEWRLS
jgi:hypothetical protein